MFARLLFGTSKRGENCRAGVLPGAATIAAGSAASQAVALLASPLLARLYCPEDIGAMGVFLSLALPISIIAPLGYQFRVVVAPDNNEAAALLIVGAISSLLLTVVTLPPLALLGLTLPKGGFSPSVWFLPAVSVAAMAGGLYWVLSSFLARQGDYRSIALTNVSQAISQNFFQVSLGFVASGLWPLIVGVVLRHFAGVMSLCCRVKRGFGSVFEGLSFRRTTRIARAHFRQAAEGGLAQAIDSLAGGVSIVFLGLLYGNSVAGWLSLCQRIFTVPLVLLGRSFAQSFFPELATAVRDTPSAVWPLFRRVVRTQGLLGVVITLVIAVPAPITFPAVFGGAWRASGIFALLLSPSYVLGFVAAAIGRESLMVFRAERLYLVSVGVQVPATAAVIAMARQFDFDAFAAVVFVGLVTAGFSALRIVAAGRLAYRASGLVRGR